MKKFFSKTEEEKLEADPTRILICGDRNWNDFVLIRETLERIGPKKIKLVISGGATGADYIAETVARILGIKVLIFPANWNKYGRAAGPIRNRQMLKEGKPSWVIAFHDTIKDSKGTKGMLAIAKKAGIRTDLITHKKPRLEK